MNHNGKNEQLKRRYSRYLADAKGHSESSIDTALAAVDRFEAYNKRRPFDRFRIEQASGFVDHLAEQTNQRTGKPLSAATQLHTLAALKAFFVWLADQPGYRSVIRYSDADYFSLSRKKATIARTVCETEGPTVEQVRYVLECLPNATSIEKRDRALIAFALATGARDNALASLRLKHVDLTAKLVRQDARDVRTKGSKTIDTFFFPVGDEILKIVDEWIAYLKHEHRWGFDDPLFPKTRIVNGTDRRFQADGFERRCWSNATPIRAIFRTSFERAGLPYFNPHSFRKTLTRLGEELCQNGKEFKAWSQNLGHEKVLTTFMSYGRLDRREQGTVILSLGPRVTPFTSR